MIELLALKKDTGPITDIDFRNYTFKALGSVGGVGTFHNAVDTYKGKLCLSGGNSSGLPSNSFYEYDPAAGTVATLGTLPAALSGHITKVIGDYLYVLCGMIDSNRTYTNVVRRFNLIDKVWETRTSCPINLCWGDACVIGTDIYMVGGSSVVASVETPAEMFLYKYDTIADTWTKITLTGISPRLANGACALNGSIYILGGRYNRVYLKDFWKYTPATGELVQLADHPDAHGARFSLFGVLKKIVNLSGQLTSDAPYRNTHQYYIEENRWELCRANVSFAYSANALMNNEFYLVGGKSSTTNYKFSL